MNDLDICVNGYPLSKWGAKAQLDYSIGETPITNDIFHGINRTNWQILRTSVGLRDIRITIIFTGRDLQEAKILRSKFNLEVFEKSELWIPDDGFYYTVMLTGTGAEELIGIGEKEAQIKSEYTFKGIRHGGLKTLGPFLGSGTFTVFCESTVPFTNYRVYSDVRLQSSLNLPGIVFRNITADNNQHLCVFDGIDNLITINGVNWANNATWTVWPKFVPGENTIVCGTGAAAYVEYYPVYL